MGGGTLLGPIAFKSARAASASPRPEGAEVEPGLLAAEAGPGVSTPEAWLAVAAGTSLDRGGTAGAGTAGVVADSDSVLVSSYSFGQ